MPVELSSETQTFIANIKKPELAKKAKELKLPQAGFDLYRLSDNLVGNPLIECSEQSSYSALRNATWTSPSVETTIDGQKALLVIGATIIEVRGHHMFNYNKYRGIARIFEDDPRKGQEVFLFESHRFGKVIDNSRLALPPEQIDRCLEIVKAMTSVIEEWRRECPLPKEYCYMFLKDASEEPRLQHTGIHFL